MLQLALLLATSFVFAAEPELLRLIQFGPLQGQRAWMSEAEITELGRRAHAEGHCGGFMDVTEHQRKSPLFLRPLTFAEPRQPTQSAVLNALLPEVSSEKLNETVAHLSSFLNRYYQSESGRAAAQWLKAQFTALGRGRTDVSVAFQEHSFKQPSVIAHIAGNGGRSAETVVIGAHLDSINWSGGSPAGALAPGADDDASGVATVLEAFRVIAQSGFRPARSIDFIAYAGEERGLLGSQDLARRFQREGRKVIGVMQLDMTMHPSRSKEMYLMTDHTDKALTNFTATLIDTYVKAPWRETQCGYACSDHASWDELGYPAVFPFEAPMDDHNPKIHTDQDLLAILDISFGLHFAKLATAFAIELANAP